MRAPTAPRLLLVLLSAWLSGCACAGRCVITDSATVRPRSIAWHLASASFLHPVRQLNPVGWIRRALGAAPRSINLIEGEARESDFFMDRRLERMAAEDVQRGPTEDVHLAQPPFTITKLKGEGKTPGFFVRDAKGDRYLFKFDPAGHPELLTGAEVVASKLLHALGYHVPSYEIVMARVDDFSLDPDVSWTPEELRAQLADHARGGGVRVVASRLVEGEIVGRINFSRYRCCVELRALKLAYTWLNNTDAKDHNSLIVRQGDGLRGYLIDFGTSLGADAARGAKRPCQGWLYDVDVKEWLVEAVTLGRHRHTCDDEEPVFSPAVGRFSPQLNPRRWKPYVPNLAFDAMTEADAQWMANRLAQVSPAQIVAAVAAGQYSRPEDAARIVEVLEARRQAILAAYGTTDGHR